MAKFDEKQVAQFLSGQRFAAFEYQAPGKVAAHFGVCAITAKRWVNRVVASGAIRNSGRVAVALVKA
jgi:hypothetical protein